MSLDQTPNPKRTFWRRILQFLWSLRFVYLQVAIIAAVIWILLPLRDATTLPNPPFPAYTPEPPDLQETLVLGPDTFTPGTQGAIRVIVYDPRSGLPVSEADVRVALAPRDRPDAGQMLFAGQTDGQGTTEATFLVPEGIEGEWALVVDTAGRVGEQRILRPVMVRRELALSLTTDKPLYGPGEIVHLRLLAMNKYDSMPLAEQPVTFRVIDARGNRIWTETTSTSAYGIAHADCELAEKVNIGTYRVVAVVGDTTVEHTISVEPYAPPRFALDIRLERPYYRLGQRAAVTVRAVYPFGKPVAGAQVEVAGSVPGAHEVFNVQGETDETGSFAFEFDLSDSLVHNSDEQTDLVTLSLIAFADDTGHIEKREASLPVSDQPVLITVWPESGRLKPGIENVIHVRTAYPDGRPAKCALTLDVPGADEEMATQTDRLGLGEFRYRPPLAGEAITLTVVAHDMQGQKSSRQFEMAVETGEHHLLLRPDQTTYRTGETMHLDVFAPDARHAVYLDVIKEGQTIATYAASLNQGRAAFDFAPAAELFGTLELQAYFILADGTVIRDARQVMVEPPHNLEVSVRTDRERYAPGDIARVTLHVTDLQGRSTPSVLSVGVMAEHWDVDRVPRYSNTTQTAVPAADLRPQRAERVSKPRPMPDRVKRQFEAVEVTRAERRQAFTLLIDNVIWALAGVSALLWIVVLVSAWLAHFKLRLGFLVGLIVLALTLGGGVLAAYLGKDLFGRGAVIVLGMSWFGVLLALFVHAWGRRDGGAHLLLALVLGILALGGGIRYATQQGGEIRVPLMSVGLAAFGATLLAIYALGAGWVHRRERGAAMTAFALILLLISTFAGVMLMGTDVQTAQADTEQVPEATRTVIKPTRTPAQPEALLFAATPTALSLPHHGSSTWQQRLGETVYWDPSAPTGAQGRLTLEIPLDGSTTAWRLFTLASTAAGGSGTAQARLEVFEPLSVEPELPTVLTVGDELDLPIAVYNALPISQSVRITVTQASWFRVRTWRMDVQEIEVPANDVGVLYFPIQVREWGEQTLEVAAQSDEWSGVISRSVTVIPDGRPISRVYSWWIDDRVRYKFRVPWSAIRGTDRVTVKLYPGHLSVIAEGLESAVRMPGDSFDQVAATTTANILWEEYLRHTGQLTPEKQARIARFVAQSYQQILTFEAADGGFSAFGAGSPDLYRTAYALRCLSDLATLYPVDKDLLDRTALWLLRQQSPEGTWQLHTVPHTWTALPRAELPATAYVAWALIDADYDRAPGVTLAIEHLERYLNKADDPYALALAVNALIAYDEPSDALDAAIVRLAEMAQVEDGLAFWPSNLETVSGAARGDPAADGANTPSTKVERTALATYALLRARSDSDLAAQGLAMLTDSRDALGTWNSPQATLWALRAFLAAWPEDGTPTEAISYTSTVSVTVDGIAADPAVFDGDVGQTLVFNELSKGYNDVEIAVDGDEIAYQIVGSYTLPWNQVPPASPEEEEVSIQISYDRTSILMGEVLTVTVGVMLNRPGVAPLVALELGLPPGLQLVTMDLDDLVNDGIIAYYAQGEGRVKVYLLDLSAEQPVRFSYRLRARYPLSVKTLPTRAFDVANPQRPAVREPIEIEVLGE